MKCPTNGRSTAWEIKTISVELVSVLIRFAQYGTGSAAEMPALALLYSDGVSKAVSGGTFREEGWYRLEETYSMEDSF